MSRILCFFGLHKWKKTRQTVGKIYLVCSRCKKKKTVKRKEGGKK